MQFKQFYDILGPNGIMSKVLPHYEYRPAQLEMANIVADAMKGQKSALIEAGTGIGKTIAYLVPLVYQDFRCVVSTGTKNLQSQIIQKDIPILERCLGRKINAYLLKGRSNYICMTRWKQFISHPGLLTATINKDLEAIQKWLKRTKTGDCKELTFLAENSSLWSEICSTTETCKGQKCKWYDRCFVTRARQEAAGADIIVVNHHLLIADCCLRVRSNMYAIPSYSRLILDEAHMLEQVATEYFGAMVSHHRIQDLSRDIRRIIADSDLESPETAKILDKVQERSSVFFGSISLNGERFCINDDILNAHTNSHLLDFVNTLSELSFQLEKLTKHCDPILNCYRRTQEIQSTLEFIYDHNDPDFVFWGERRRHHVSLRVSPIDVSQELSLHLFKSMKGIVLTSATLSTNQGFDYIKSRLGVPSDYELILESHFDYHHQAMIFIPKEMPSPAQDTFSEQLGPQIEQIIQITKGRALLLFTSYRNLEKAYLYLKEKGLKYSLLKQGNAPREHLLNEFLNDISSILLATSSFWQGIDIPGESLSCVLIDRLPFSVPTDPITEARINWIRVRGGNPFQEYQLPSAIILLKQGFGRLIRNKKDRGLLVILDPRIMTKSYGKVIFRNLPNCPVFRSLDAVANGMKRWSNN